MQELSTPFNLIKKSVNIFAKKENLVYLVKIYLPLATVSAFSLVLTLPTAFVETIESNTTLAYSLGGFLQMAYVLVSIFVYASAVIGLKKITEGKEFSLKKTFNASWKVYWKVLTISIVLFLLYALGFALLIIPGMLFLVWFVFSRFLLIEKGAGIKESLFKSKEMVKGVYWKILGRLVVFALFTLLVQIVLSVLPFGLGAIAVNLCGCLFILPTYLLYKEISE